MATVTLTVSEDVKSEIRRFSWVNWSEAAREELERQEKAKEDFERFKEIVAKSKLTEEDAIKLGRAVNKALHERYKKLYKGLK